MLAQRFAPDLLTPCVFVCAHVQLAVKPKEPEGPSAEELAAKLAE
jgi:hypothetical protein